MKDIVCRYIGPSNFRGSRIKAFAEGNNSVTISYPHELSGSDVYRLAADALCKKMKWEGELIEGGLPNGDYVFVFAPKSSTVFNGNWESYACPRAESKGYQVWVDRGLWAVYNIRKIGEGKPDNESGYRSLDALLQMKGIA